MDQTQKTFFGKVTSTKMSGVIVVEVIRQRKHPMYKKTINKSKKFHVRNTVSAKAGDEVVFVETRPYSRTVRWETLSVSKTANRKTPGSIPLPTKKEKSKPEPPTPKSKKAPKGKK